MDDEEMICKVAARFLAKEGFLTEITHEGREAIVSYRRAMERGQPFDLVIMDLTIPGGMGGREAVTRLLDLDPQARVIVSSGYAEDPVLADYRRHGFRGIAPKPYTREGLLQVVRQALRES
jgi:CheY-like chemotaxis protein